MSTEECTPRGGGDFQLMIAVKSPFLASLRPLTPDHKGETTQTHRVVQNTNRYLYFKSLRRKVQKYINVIGLALGEKGTKLVKRYDRKLGGHPL
jgi:hypothetical protein